MPVRTPSSCRIGQDALRKQERFSPSIQVKGVLANGGKNMCWSVEILIPKIAPMHGEMEGFEHWGQVGGLKE